MRAKLRKPVSLGGRTQGLSFRLRVWSFKRLGYRVFLGFPLKGVIGEYIGILGDYIGVYRTQITGFEAVPFKG